jgi:hypothetical protein
VFLGVFLFGRLGQASNGIGSGTSEATISSGSSAEGDGGQSSQQETGENDEGGTQQEAPAPTVTLPSGSSEGSKLVLIYNAGGFYAWNPGPTDIIVREFVFEAVDNNDTPTGFVFEGRRWAGIFPRIQVGKCSRLEILNNVQKERPSQCRGYNAIITPEESDLDIFWLPKDNVSQFRVIMGGVEIGRCQIENGQCEVLIP